MIWEPGYDPTRSTRVELLTERVFAALTSLPARSDNPRSENEVRRWAAQIANCAPWPMPFPNAMKRAKRSVIQKEIRDFSEAIKRAETILTSFHNPTFGKALEAGTSVWDIRDSMQLAIDFAYSLSEISLEDLPDESKKAGKGAERSRAEVVAQFFANYYYWITGEYPSRSFSEGTAVVSNFVQVLEEIFLILEVDASADGAAKVAIQEFTTKRTNWSRKSSNPSI